MPLDLKQEPPYYTIDDVTPTPVDPIVPPGTKIYTAILTQTSTNAPTQTVIYNTLTNTPSYSYDSVGTYKITLTGEFTVDKTIIKIGEPQYTGVILATFANSVNELTIITQKQNATTQEFERKDGYLFKTPITIYVYP